MGNVYRLRSINEVLGKLKIDFENLTFINEDHFIEWIADALKHIGAFGQLVMKEENVVITNHKGSIPCDCYKVVDILKVTSLRNTEKYFIGVTNDTLHVDYYLQRINDLQIEINNSSDLEHIKKLTNILTNIKLIVNNEPHKFNTISLDYDTNLYLNTTLVGNVDANKHYNNDLKIEFDVITTGFPEGYVNLKYLALPTDDEGYPLIPDDVSYYEAIYWYISMKLSLQGKLNNSQLNYQICRTEWGRKCVQARANINMPTLKEMQEMMNENLKLVPDINQYYKQFRDLGKRQVVKRH